MKRAKLTACKNWLHSITMILVANKTITLRTTKKMMETFNQYEAGLNFISQLNPNIAGSSHNPAISKAKPTFLLSPPYCLRICVIDVEIIVWKIKRKEIPRKIVSTKGYFL